MESILTSVKKLLGIDEDYKQFDTDIIIHINSVFMVLTQIGVGPSEGFSISDEYSTWEDFISDKTYLNSVKTYMYLRVKLLFDPPLSSAALDSLKKLADEFEWRLQVAAENNKSTEEEDETYE
jgi:hypothetical protein